MQAAVLISSLFFAVAGAPLSSLLAIELLPNLQSLPPANVRIESTDTQAGSGVTLERVLRFTNAVANRGSGPLHLFGEVVGADPSAPVPATQIVRLDDGISTAEYPAGEFTFHPEHGHWHWSGFADYSLRQAVDRTNPFNPANAIVAGHGKVSFCIIDTFKIRQFPGSGQPSSAQYTQCGTNTQGISVGWGDEYGSYLFDQWIVLGPYGAPGSVADGTYWLATEVDPLDKLRESNNGDNAAASLISISRNGTRVRAVR